MNKVGSGDGKETNLKKDLTLKKGGTLKKALTLKKSGTLKKNGTLKKDGDLENDYLTATGELAFTEIDAIVNYETDYIANITNMVLINLHDWYRN